MCGFQHALTCSTPVTGRGSTRALVQIASHSARGIPLSARRACQTARGRNSRLAVSPVDTFLIGSCAAAPEKTRWRPTSPASACRQAIHVMACLAVHGHQAMSSLEGGTTLTWPQLAARCISCPFQNVITFSKSTKTPDSALKSPPVITTHLYDRKPLIGVWQGLPKGRHMESGLIDLRLGNRTNIHHGASTMAPHEDYSHKPYQIQAVLPYISPSQHTHTNQWHTLCGSPHAVMVSRQPSTRYRLMPRATPAAAVSSRMLAGFLSMCTIWPEHAEVCARLTAHALPNQVLRRHGRSRVRMHPTALLNSGTTRVPSQARAPLERVRCGERMLLLL